MPSSCMIEGTFIDGASFDVVQSDGRFGACQFETIAAAQGDGTSAKGLRAAASAFASMSRTRRRRGVWTAQQERDRIRTAISTRALLAIHASRVRPRR